MEIQKNTEAPAEKVKREIHEELSKLKDAVGAIAVPLEHREDGALTKIRIGTHVVDCSAVPLERHSAERKVNTMRAMLARLETSPRFSKRTPNEEVALALVDEVRLSCAIGKDRLVCTAYDVFRVEADDVDISTQREKESAPALRAKGRRTRILIGQGTPETEEEKKIHGTFKGTGDEWSRLMSESYVEEFEADEIDAKAHARLLVDEKTGERLHEYKIDGSSGIARQYPAAKSGLKKIDRHDIDKRVVEFVRADGTLHARDVFDLDRRPVSRTMYGPKGEPLKTLHHVRANDEYEMTYITEHKPAERKLFSIVDAGEERYVDPLDPSLPKKDKELLLERIDKASIFDVFEEVYLERLGAMRAGDERKDTALAEAWRKGAELHGVRQKIDAIEAKMRGLGLKDFRVDCFPRISDSASYSRMANVSQTLDRCLEGLSPYPDALIANARPKGLGILRDPRINKMIAPVGGFYDPTQERMVMNSVESATKNKHTWHHEWFHLLDDRAGMSDSDDDDWTARFHGHDNYPDGRSVYGRGVIEIRDENGGGFSTMGRREPGFSRGYGMHTPNEDQATVAEAFFDPKTAYDQESLARVEPVLAEKIATIKRRYFILSEGRMDERYWKDIRDGGTIDAAYWKKREDAGDFKTPEHAALAAQMAYERTLPTKAFSPERIWKEKTPEERKKLQELCIETLTKNPHNEGAVRMLAVLINFEGSDEEKRALHARALPELRKRMELLQPIDREESSYELMASAETANGRPAEATAVLREGLATVPRSYDLKKALIRNLQSIDATASAAEITALMEQAYEQTRKTADCLELCAQYAAVGTPEKALPLLQSFMEKYAFDEDGEKTRRMWEDQMTAAKRTDEIERTYERLAKKNPDNAALCAVYVAQLHGYRLKNDERAIGDFRKALAAWPRNRAVTWTAEQYGKDAALRLADPEKQAAFSGKLADAYKQALVESGDIALASGYTSLMRKTGSPERASEAYRFVHDRFRKDVLHALREKKYDNESFDSFGGNLLSWNEYAKETTASGPGLGAFEEIADAFGDDPNTRNRLVKNTFGTLILAYEKTDAAKALRLCERYVTAAKKVKKYEFVAREAEYQSAYLRTLEKPGAWVAVEGVGTVASAKEEPGMLYVQQKNGDYLRHQRWVDTFGDFDWTGDASSRTKKLAPADLPQSLRPKEK